MSCVGRTTLTKVTLPAIPIHVSIAVVVAPWIYCVIDRLCHGLILMGPNTASGGQCMVA
jgi:hypothetical protein